MQRHSRRRECSVRMSQVDNILASVDLLSIAPDCDLKSVGQDRWRGRCPISDHRSLGTFAVSRHRDGHLIFQCFACGKRGSVIDLYAAMNNVTIREAIRSLGGPNVPALSRDSELQRSYDSWQRQQPGYAWLICDSCGTMLKIEDELSFFVLCGLGSWLWDVCRDGSAKCIKCRKIN